MVRDMPASLHFYCEVLGLRLLSPPEFKGPKFLQAGGGAAYLANMIVLAPGKADTPPFAAPQSLHHIGLQVDGEQFDAEVARLQQLGYEVRFGKHPLFPSRTAYVTDPDGNEVELISPA